MEVYEIDVLESFECIGGGTDELVLWSDGSATIRHIPANERVCPVCGCELVPTQVPTEECDDLLLCCYNESCNYQVASKALV